MTCISPWTRPPPSHGRPDQRAARSQHEHRRRGHLGAPLHDPRSRSDPRWTGRDRRLAVQRGFVLRASPLLGSTSACTSSAAAPASLPHIDMTIEALSRRGIRIERPAVGEWLIGRAARQGDRDRTRSLQRRRDPLAAALVAGGIGVDHGLARPLHPGPDASRHVGRHGGTLHRAPAPESAASISTSPRPAN